MKILVFDDDEINRQSALLTLEGHDVTVVGTYDEAQNALLIHVDRLDESVRVKPHFDAVLTDLFVPCSRQALSSEVAEEFYGQEAPLGTTIALLAITAGVKNIAVVTSGSHHDHPAIAALDCFWGCDAPGLGIVCTSHPDYVQVEEGKFGKDWGRVLDRLLHPEPFSAQDYYPV